MRRLGNEYTVCGTRVKEFSFCLSYNNLLDRFRKRLAPAGLGELPHNLSILSQNVSSNFSLVPLEPRDRTPEFYQNPVPFI